MNLLHGPKLSRSRSPKLINFTSPSTSSTSQQKFDNRDYSSADSSVTSNDSSHHKKHHRKRKKSSHNRHNHHDDEKNNDYQNKIIQEVKEWQQKLRSQKSSSSSTIINTSHNDDDNVESIVKPSRRPIMAPQTKAEYEAEQSIIREVVDPIDGRVRLIRGSGEVVERIVSRKEHKRINKQATRGDAITYQKRWTERANIN
ncbi:5101_t:CDS:2 [Entrophospora sp. SA101]|nr:2569_t:CDS:2 [Entrophospora sp. SA101]CAJ0632386.1 5101_t:CDS:2 [Entrophospora sp. SA101]